MEDMAATIEGTTTAVDMATTTEMIIEAIIKEDPDTGGRQGLWIDAAPRAFRIGAAVNDNSLFQSGGLEKHRLLSGAVYRDMNETINVYLNPI
jgi:hypothetical protein